MPWNDEKRLLQSLLQGIGIQPVNTAVSHHYHKNQPAGSDERT